MTQHPTFPDFDQISPELIDGRNVPPEFIAEHLSVDEFSRLLHVSMDQLFDGCANGLVPRPIVLPTCPAQPVWNAKVIQQWLEAGAPPDEAYVRHQRIVLDRLLESIRDSLSANPPIKIKIERN